MTTAAVMEMRTARGGEDVWQRQSTVAAVNSIDSQWVWQPTGVAVNGGGGRWGWRQQGQIAGWTDYNLVGGLGEGRAAFYLVLRCIWYRQKNKGEISHSRWEISPQKEKIN